MTKVFISYSHDSDAHREFVRSISDRLRSEGLDCLIDLYVNGFPPEGWQRWMENQIEAADFVLMVCTETYLRRYRGQETEGGRGVTFEGVVISQTLYDHYYRNTKFIPVIPANGSLDNVPIALKAYSTYCLPDDYDKLYRVLTAQPEYQAPPLGQVRKLVSNGGVAPAPVPTQNPSIPGWGTQSINNERRVRLQEKLRRLYEQYDLETRVEEKMRMKVIIDQTENDLQGL